jgi:hypothetical protein
LPIRWRLTLFIALAIGMILLALGLTLYLLNRNALLKSLEETAENGAKAVADTIEAGEKLSSAADDDDQLILDEVGVIIRDKDGGILQREGLQAVSSADDNVWRRALKKKKAVRGKAVFAGDNYYYVVALPGIGLPTHWVAYPSKGLVAPVLMSSIPLVREDQSQTGRKHLSVAEASEVLGITVETVRGRILSWSGRN